MLKIDCKGKRTVGKANKGINAEKITKVLKKLKLIKKEKKKQKQKTSQSCKNPIQTQKFITTIKNVWEKIKKENFKNLIRFHSANKIDKYNRGGVGREKKIQRTYRSQNKNKNAFSWVTAVRVLSLAASHSPPHFPRMPSNTLLISWPATRAAQILICSYSCVFLPPVSTAVRTSAFSLVGALNDLLYIEQKQNLPSWSCGFNLQLVQLVGGFWVFFSHTAPGFQLWFYLHLCVWVVYWDLLLRLPWWTWLCPCEGQVWRWCSCLSFMDSGSTRYSGVGS